MTEFDKLLGQFRDEAPRSWYVAIKNVSETVEIAKEMLVKYKIHFNGNDVVRLTKLIMEHEAELKELRDE